jgi:putative transposase
MPWKRRLCLPEITYHVVSRCIEKRSMMKSKKIKDLMVQVVNMALDKYLFEISAYSIMDNHFHFYIRTVRGGEDISRIMQFIKSQIARRYNRMMDRTGPFWNERFKDTIIETSSSPIFLFFYILFYIFNNPVRSNYVNDPRKYQYGSINSYFDEEYQSPIKITLHPYFIRLGNTFKERFEKLLKIEEAFRKRIFDEALFA